MDMELEGLEGVDAGPSRGEKGEGYWVPPQMQPSSFQILARGEKNAAHAHIAAGAIDSALLTLHQSAAIVNFEPLKKLALRMFAAGRATVHGLPNAPPLFAPLTLNSQPAQKGGARIRNYLSLQQLIDQLKIAYRLTTGGKFNQAQIQFKNIIHSLAFITASNKQEETELQELMTLCREYLIGLQVEAKRKELANAKKDPIRQCELAAYFTNCQLQPIHLMLLLQLCMKLPSIAELQDSVGNGPPPFGALPETGSRDTSS